MKINTYQESLAQVLSSCRPLPVEIASFFEAMGRVLADDVCALDNDPPAAKSAMDGFCLRAFDTQAASPGSPIDLPVSGVLGAGHLPQERLDPGTALRIMTGALLPEGADAVVKQEDTSMPDERTVVLETPLTAGENVIAEGQHLRSGDQVLRSGDRVTPQALGMLAKLGISSLQVHQQPRVALLAIGDELLELTQPLKPGKLHVSNLYALEGSILQYGGISRRLGIARDDPDQIEDFLRPCLPESKSSSLTSDIVVTLGGSSRGDFDFACEVFERLGAAIQFRRTQINLGPSTIFATKGSTLFFGLPGTPIPSWGAFELLMRPALLKLAGCSRWQHPCIQARLTDNIRAGTGPRYFVPGWLRFDSEGLAKVTPLRSKSSGTNPSALLANALIEVPEFQSELEKGTSVSVRSIGSDDNFLH
ncbi:MAG: molybdopterin molybdotransferase MoeA [SAR324 cluster bacterium]|nr:molybdopterin molybdotransferase MoeA [SAR324 cluster bacterium]